jgi:AraC-like DNA-binding protein
LIGEKMREIGLEVLGSTGVPTSTDVRRVARYNEMIWVIDGHTIFEFAGQEIPVGPSQLILYPPQSDLGFRAASGVVILIGVAHFRGSIDLESPLVVGFADNELITALLAHLLWLEATAKSGWRDRAEHVLAYVIEVLLEGGQQTRLERDARFPLWLRPVIDLVRAEWREPPFRNPALPVLARAARMSPEHLTRLFRQWFGVPPVRALRLMRLQCAADLLRESNLTVKEVAGHCGFANEYHFSTAFKQVAGVSPRRYSEGIPQPSFLPPSLRRIYATLWTE